MNLVTALALVIGLLGGVATLLFIGPLAPFGLQIWAAFLAWASFFGAGGTRDALVKSLAANLWGVLWATIALVLVGKFGGGGVVVIGAIVGVAVGLMILGAHIPLLSVVPAQVYGFAPTAAFGLLKGAPGTDLGLGTGPFTTIAVSMIIGALFGFASAKIAAMLPKASNA